MAGRKPGARNKKTIEREMLAEIVKKRQDAAYAGRKLAKEVLEELMIAAMAFVARYQPHPSNERNQNEEKFMEWLQVARGVASDLAPYQSPTFRAVVIGQAPDAQSVEGDIDEARRKIGKLLDLKLINGSANGSESGPSAPSPESSAIN